MAIAFREQDKYAIGPAEYRCCACTVDVAVEAPFFSAVFLETEAFARRTFCPPCWEHPDRTPQEAFAYWRSRRPQPDAPVRKIRFDPEMVLEFFRRLKESTAPAADEAARLQWVLALLLLRRKTLVLESSPVRDGREFIQLKEKARPDVTHLVECLPLDDAQVAAIQASLSQLLQMDMG